MNKTNLLILIFACLLLNACNKKINTDEHKFCPSYRCQTITLAEIISGQESEHQDCSTALVQGSLTLRIPEKWLLDTTRLFEVRISRDSDEGAEKIEISKVMNVSLNADPDEFKAISKPQDLSETIPDNGFASWSWCLKPKKSGCLYLCLEIDVKGKEFGQKVFARAIPILIEPLPFWGGIMYFIDTHFIRLVTLASLLLGILTTILTTINQWIPRFKTSRQVRKKLDGIEKSIQELNTKINL